MISTCSCLDAGLFLDQRVISASDAIMVTDSPQPAGNSFKSLPIEKDRQLTCEEHRASLSWLSLSTCNTSTVLPYPKTIVKLQEKYWKLARNGPKSMVGFWESFYEDRIYPSREEFAIA